MIEKEIFIVLAKNPQTTHPAHICVAAGGMGSYLPLEPSGFALCLPYIYIYTFLPLRKQSSIS